MKKRFFPQMSAMNIDLDMRFSVLRKKREVERKRHVGQMGKDALGMDSISFEEVSLSEGRRREESRESVCLCLCFLLGPCHMKNHTIMAL